MTYREVPLPDAHLRCEWWRSAGEGGVVRVLPDACVDVVGDEEGRLVVAGPDTGPVAVALGTGAVRFGVRLRPGAAAAALGVPARELRDRRVPLWELWGDVAALEERVAAGTPAERAAMLREAVLDRLREPPDPLVRAAAARLGRAPELRVAALAADLGVSERQLLRRFDAAVGYGPKTLGRVLRLRRLLALERPRAGLARAAYEAGYADQAHMTADVRRLTGLTPSALLR